MSENLGTLAFYDSLYSGLIPVKVTGIRVYNEFGHYEVFFTVTATRGAYKKGEKFVSNPRNVVPRKMVGTKWGRLTIKTYYAWVERDGKTFAIVNR